MANEAYIEEIVLESSTSSSSLAVDLSAGFSSDSSLEMLIVKGQHQAKSETFTLNTTTSSSSGLNLQRSLTSDQDRWSIGSSVDRPMDSQHSAVDSSGWLQMKINFSSLSFSDSVGSKTVTDEDRRQASDRLSSIDQTFKSNDDDDQDSWDKIKKDIKWSLGFQSQSSWTSSSDLPKQPSWSDDNSIVGPSGPAANHDDGDSDGLERINSDFMSWSSSSAGVANISSNTINNALFRNFSFEDSLYLQMNTSTSSTNYESSLVGIVKMAENIKKTVGS
ncbi:uncharacterized protein LOC126843491 [Adelges cooleyi]|uniref:uncharacterized protein LOC126843491 n=1 Tax=Adelges cooleyi TaxID=133065 RepID=UPI00217FBA2C|nr:uncharacterized protein LOC126843491 [Adelges cooleyi]